MEDSGLSYGAQYVAYGEFLGDSPWGIGDSDKEYNQKIKKMVGEMIINKIGGSLDIEPICKKSACGKCDQPLPYMDFEGVKIPFEGKDLDAGVHVFLGIKYPEESEDSYTENTVIYAAATNDERIPFGMAAPYFDKLAIAVKSFVKDLSKDYCEEAGCKMLVPFYAKGIGIGVPIESQLKVLFCNDKNKLEEAFNSSSELKKIVSDFKDVHGDVKPVEIPINKAKELLNIPAYAQVPAQENPKLDIDSYSLVESSNGNYITRTSLTPEGERPSIKKTYLLEFSGRDEIKNVVYYDFLLKSVQLARLDYRKSNGLPACLKIGRLCQL